MKNKNGQGRTKEVNGEISRVFDGLPIVDAKNDLRVVIMQSDINKGKPKDFDACVFAQACKRVFSSKKVILMRSIAYISLPDENGDYKVERYIITDDGMKVIADFDRGKMPKPGTSFVFRAPSGTRTLDGARKRTKKYREKMRSAKMIGDITGEIPDANGNNVEEINKKSKQKITAKPILDIRNGSGLIKMRRHK